MAKCEYIAASKAPNLGLGKLAMYNYNRFSMQWALWGCLLLSIFFYSPNICRSASDENVDLFFVIDNSGSMRKNDPEFMTPQIVLEFLQRLSPTTRVGMVAFDKKARLLEPLAPVAGAKAKERLIQSLVEIDYKGKFTNSAAGIERALYEFSVSGRPVSQKCVVFLTDGIMDTGDWKKDGELTQWLKNDLAMEIREKGIRIFGIAFTENADSSLIQALSLRTGGSFYRAFKPEDIADILNRIQLLLAPAPDPPTPTNTLQIQPNHPQSEEKFIASAAVDQNNKLEPEKNNHKASQPELDNDAFKFSLSKILFGCVLIGLLIVLVLKGAGWPLHSFVPALFKRSPSVASIAEEDYRPEWQLHEMEKTGNYVTNFKTLKIRIGRDKKSDFVIDKPTVSNIHATIEYRDAAFFLEDSRSKNGTRLNDRNILPEQPVRLKSGDRIKFAGHEFKFVCLDQILSGDTVLLEVTRFSSKQQEPSSSSMPFADDEAHMRDALNNHIKQIKAFGPKYDDFINRYFSEAIIQTLSVYAYDNILQTMAGGDQHCSPMVKGQAFYIVCTLPVPISRAANYFSQHYGGFNKFILKWIKSDAYDVTRCDTLCIVTFGLEPESWVSMTIVPTHEAEDSVEIMSMDFLTEAEQASLKIGFDEHGRVM
jgi:pSer/pThr/pTyr-binding forkhead associated (FHA) protein/Mg-chelatase subunit ChlD